jgi:amidase
MENYTDYDATGLAALVRDQSVSPDELIESAIARIERHNPQLNAVIHPLYTLGREQARSREYQAGPFFGVPFLVKDLLTTWAGAPYSKGCKALKGYLAPADSEMMRRYRSAGLVTIGKTNTPEFGLTAVTEPEAFGPSRNPWDTSRTPGGSSGGSAAAVAAGFVPMAGGGDGGGSIRIPASCCGLFGLKPSRGRTPTAPCGEHWQGAAQEHVLTRSVRDSAAVLDAIQGSAAGAPYIIAPPQQPYLEAVSTPAGKLRIAFSTESPLHTPVDDACITAVGQAARLLEELGHSVEEKTPPTDGPALARAYLTLYFGEVAADLLELGEMIGRPATAKDVEPFTWLLGLMGRTIPAVDFVRAKQQWNIAGRVMGEFYQHYDLFLTPTMAVPPPVVGSLTPGRLEQIVIQLITTFGLGRALKASGMIDRIAVESLAKTPFTQLANLTGLPAMSVPLHWADAGTGTQTHTVLPIGVHFMAPFGEEARLFSLAAQLEQAQPWFDRRPPSVP